MRRLDARTAATTAAGQVAGKAALVIVSLASTAIVTRRLGPSGYATWGSVLTFSAMLGFLVEPGFAPAVVRRIASGREAVPTPRALLLARVPIAIGVYAAVVALAVAVRGGAALALAAVMAAEIFPRAITLNVSTWLQAYHRAHRQTAIEVGAAITGVAALVIAAAAHAPAAVLGAAAILLPAVVLAGASQRALARLPHGPVSTDRGAIRSVLREAAPLAVAVILVSVYTRIDVVFVAAAPAPNHLGDYVLSFRFVEMLIIVAGILAATLLPMLAARAPAERLPAEPFTHTALIGTTAVGAVVSLLLVALAEPLISVLAPASFGQAAGLLVLLAPTAIALFLNFFLAYLLMAMRQGRRYVMLNAAALALNLGANAAFTLAHGPQAAARITWITELSVALVGLWRLCRDERTLRPAAARCLALAAICVAASEAAFAGAPAGAVAAVGLVAVLAVAAGPLRTAIGLVVSPASSADG